MDDFFNKPSNKYRQIRGVMWVRVRDYYRIVRGKIQYVRSHYRRVHVIIRG